MEQTYNHTKPKTTLGGKIVYGPSLPSLEWERRLEANEDTGSRTNPTNVPKEINVNFAKEYALVKGRVWAINTYEEEEYNIIHEAIQIEMANNYIEMLQHYSKE